MNQTILIVKRGKLAVTHWATVFENAGYCVLSYTGDEAQWPQFIEHHTPSLLFIEAAFANDRGFELARLAMQLHPALRCVVCMPTVPGYYLKAIQVDASGYLPDDIDDADEVLHCLEQVRQGYRYINTLFLEFLRLPTQRHMELMSALSDRQKQILSLLAKGQTARRIAQELGLAESTVQNHKSQISRLVGLAGVYQLKIFAGSVAHLLP